MGADYIGLLVLGVVNASIPREHIRKEFSCDVAQGEWRSSKHASHVIKVGSYVRFTVARWAAYMCAQSHGLRSMDSCGAGVVCTVQVKEMCGACGCLVHVWLPLLHTRITRFSNNHRFGHMAAVTNRVGQTSWVQQAIAVLDSTVQLTTIRGSNTDYKHVAGDPLYLCLHAPIGVSLDYLLHFSLPLSSAA